MIGKWKGYYKRESKQITVERRNQKTGFTVEITVFNNGVFKGTIQDDLNTDGMKGIGVISGFIKNNHIKFIKEMPIQTLLIGDKRIETEHKHAKIFYQGKYDKQLNAYQGAWKMKFGFFKYNRRLAIRFPTKGIWEMQKLP